MALIKCPECGRENVSDTATSCPQCGFNISKYFSENNYTVDEKSSEEIDSVSFSDTHRTSSKKRSIPLFLCVVFFVLMFTFGYMRSDCKREIKQIQLEIEDIEKDEGIKRTLYTVPGGSHYSENEYLQITTELRERKNELKDNLKTKKNKSTILLIGLIGSIIVFIICVLVLI